MHNFTISCFQNLYNTEVHQLDISWDEVKDFFIKEHQVTERKDQVLHFNAAIYQSDAKSSTRKNINIIGVSMIILDYDGGCCIKEVKQRIKKYEYVAYTTYSHGKDKKIDKFRVIIPMTRSVSFDLSFNNSNIKIESGEWNELVPSLKKMFPDCDDASFKIGQIFAYPSTTKDRSQYAKRWHNKGDLLNPDKIARTVISNNSSITTTSSSVVPSDRNTLPANTVFNTTKEPVIFHTVQRRISKVLCPIHDDKKPSEFLNVSNSGNIFFHCSKCGTYYMEHDINNDSIIPIKKDKPKNITDKQLKLLEKNMEFGCDINELFDERFSTPDRERMKKILQQIKKKIVKGRETKWDSKPLNHVIYTPEGSGKSQLTLDIVKNRGLRVLFAVKSWDQAEQKFSELKKQGEKYGLVVEIARSLEGKIKRKFNVNTIRKQPYTPFSPGEIDRTRTLNHIIENNKAKFSEKFIKLVYLLIHPEKTKFSDETGKLDLDISYPIKPSRAYISKNQSRNGGSIKTKKDSLNPEGYQYREDDSNLFYTTYFGFDWQKDTWQLQLPENQYKTANIVITTYSQANLLARLKNRSPSKNWIIMYDDIGLQDLLRYVSFNKADWSHLSKSELEERTEDIDGYRFFERKPFDYSGIHFRNNSVVYTTTEKLTLDALKYLHARIKEKHQLYKVIPPSKELIIHDEMESLTGSKITVLGTKFVRSTLDGIIPLLVERLKKQGYKVKLIGDGFGIALNHVNSKGRNDLKDTHLIVELSIPHPMEIRAICESLKLNFATDKRQIIQNLMQDKLNQAIGRNSGYRYAGAECVVLTDPQYHKWLVNDSRYDINKSTSVLIDRRCSMSKKDRRIPPGEPNIIRELETLLSNNLDYVADRRKFNPDVLRVLKDIKDPKKRNKAIQRMCTALLNLSEYSIEPLSQEIKQRVLPYRRGVVLVLKQLPKNKRKNVLKNSIKLLKL